MFKYVRVVSYSFIWTAMPRKDKQMSKKRKVRVKNKIVRHRSREIPQHKCIFCGTTDSIERHHIIQKRFNGSNDESNLVPICSRCHSTYHWITDQLLNYLLAHKKIDQHEVRPVPPIITEIPKETPPVNEVTAPAITITGSTVTINFDR